MWARRKPSTTSSTMRGDGWLRPAESRCEPSAFHCQHASGAVRGRKQKARDECEMIDEEAELGLARGPPRGSVERETEEDHISRGQERGFRKIGAGQEARDQRELEQGREPGQELRQREAGRRDVGGRSA